MESTTAVGSDRMGSLSFAIESRLRQDRRSHLSHENRDQRARIHQDGAGAAACRVRKLLYLIYTEP